MNILQQENWKDCVMKLINISISPETEGRWMKKNKQLLSLVASIWPKGIFEDTKEMIRE